jgi:predicted DCC family thiol-disulfide oxidoreductase YuxK
MAEEPSAIVLFDGVCNLCNGAVQFVLDHERTCSPGSADQPLRFAALQSEAARKVLESAVSADEAARLRTGNVDGGEPPSIVLVEGGRAYVRSTAALRIARYLRAPWRWVSVLLVVPRTLRDPVYRVIARYRYRWFGRSETCRVPEPELRERFLG